MATPGSWVAAHHADERIVTEFEVDDSGTARFTLRGELDLATIGPVRDEVNEALARDRQDGVVPARNPTRPRNPSIRGHLLSPAAFRVMEH